MAQFQFQLLIFRILQLLLVSKNSINVNSENQDGRRVVSKGMRGSRRWSNVSVEE